MPWNGGLAVLDTLPDVPPWPFVGVLRSAQAPLRHSPLLHSVLAEQL